MFYSFINHRTNRIFVNLSKKTTMAGIYFHIPFCKTRCTYCDFYTQTDFSLQQDVVNAMLREIEIRKTYLSEEVETIYFGGGTPSTLSAADIKNLLNAVSSFFSVNEDAEITIEANPDDLSAGYLKELIKTGVNRLSIGIQSFDDLQLKAINRRHTARAALDCINVAHQTGFENISIDLIFGLPGQSPESWKMQVDMAVKLRVQHISAYGLTYEQGTPLWHRMKSGKIIPTDDDTMIEMYNYLVETCSKSNFEHYEISNFAKPGHRSRHNSAYWKQRPYLGIGSAAHSYDGNSRQWNVSSNKKYCSFISENQPFFEKEILTLPDKYNDFVMVSMRTIEGIDLESLKNNFGEKLHDFCLQSAEKYIQDSKIVRKFNFLRLTSEGIHISDKIIADMMYV